MTFVLITFLSINAGQYATTSFTLGLPPANPVIPGGPAVIRGANSLVNRVTIFLS